MGANIWNSIPQAMRQLQKYRFKNNNNWILFSNLLKTEFKISFISIYVHVALLAFTYTIFVSFL